MANISMANISGKASANDFNNPVVALLNGVKIGLLFAVGFALVCMLQATFFSSGAIASPLANIKIAETSKELARNVKEGTKANIGKAKNAAKNSQDKIGDGVDKAKKIASDRTNEVRDGAKDLPEKAGNKVDEAIDSVKNFLGQ